MNDAGLTVGWMTGPEPGTWSAMLWTPWLAVDLNNVVMEPETLHLETAAAMDARGRIAGHGCAPDGVTQAFLLMPTSGVSDLDGDGYTGVSDIAWVLARWGGCGAEPYPCPADIDLDGIVGITDLLLVLRDWG